MTSDGTRMTGWGGHPTGICPVVSPSNVEEVRRMLRSTPHTITPRGLGRAYGDSAISDRGFVASSLRLDKFHAFEESTGFLDAEAGVSLAEIIDAFLPRGWFLPTTPGTKFVTLGGAIAADVHGKNHHQVGSIGNFIDRVELLLADGRVARCSRNEDPELFFATLGGMGLTGFILAARLRLVPVETSMMRVQYTKTRDLDETLSVFACRDSDYEHSVAWIDCLGRKSGLGRSVVMQANHARHEELPASLAERPYALPRSRGFRIPFTLPFSLIGRGSVSLFNEVFYSSHSDRTVLVDLNSFFYPLDSIGDWNRLYGRRGFIQYQALFPYDMSHRGLTRLLAALATAGCASFLAVLKRCGPADGGMLSFAEPGHTLALDIPFSPNETPALCRTLDRILLEHGGRLYLAKDAMTDAATFHQMYPRIPDFLAVKRRVDPDDHFMTAQAARLNIRSTEAAAP